MRKIPQGTPSDIFYRGRVSRVHIPYERKVMDPYEIAQLKREERATRKYCIESDVCPDCGSDLRVISIGANAAMTVTLECTGSCTQQSTAIKWFPLPPRVVKVDMPKRFFID